jgi:hypothetical protein
MRNRGTKFVNLIDETIIYLWASERKEDCFFFIEKICEYIEKNNLKAILKYFSMSIHRLSYKLSLNNKIQEFDVISESFG